MSFLRDYREYASGSEAHPTYHTFSALVALSSIVSRKVWIDMGFFNVYPNLYVILVGPAGNRKTSAMSVAKGLLRELKEKVPFSAECVTKEKLVMDIRDQERIIEGLPDTYAKQRIYTPMTIMVTELSEFLGAGGVGMINFLTTIYDQDFYDHRTKNKGDVLITGPFLNLLACTTPDWITAYLRTDVISGGFSRRAIFVLETGKSGRIPFPEVTSTMRAAWDRCLNHAKLLLQTKGQFKWDPEAKTFFEKWYVALKIPTDPMIVGYYETKHIQLLKISMLIALSDSTDLVLKVNHLERGLALLQLAEDNLLRVFSGMGRNILNAASQKVMDQLNMLTPQEVKHPVSKQVVSIKLLPEKQLRSNLWREVNGQEMDEVLKHLSDSEKIERWTISGGASGGARTFIVLK
jgi:hypothetical protein